MSRPTMLPTDIRAAILLDESTIILFGAAAAAPPAAAIAAFADAGRSGRFESLAWPRQGDAGAGRWFVAAVSSPDITEAKSSALALKPEDGGASVRIEGLPPLQLNPSALLLALKEEVPAQLGAAFGFFRHTLRAFGDGAPSGRARRFLFAFLHAISEPDGFVEIFGNAAEHGLVLQGWSFRLKSGAADFLVETEGLSPRQALVGSFDRADLLSSARGILAYLREAGGIDPAAIRRIYYPCEGAWYHLDIFEQRMILGPAETLPHCRDMLPKLKPEPRLQAALKRLCSARYEGQETLSAMGLPVRIGIDLALHAAGKGTYVGGWLLDPERLVREVRLCSGEAATRIDDGWARIARPDVVEAYRPDPIFSDRLDAVDARQGFIAWVPAAPAEIDPASLHLELAFADESLAFVPLAATAPLSPAVLPRLLGGLDIQDPLIRSVIAGHVGPMLFATASARKPCRREPETVAFGQVAAAEDRVSIVLPAVLPAADLDLNLALLAADPALKETELLVAAPCGCGHALARLLERYGDFYGLHGRLLLSPDPLDAFEALELGAGRARTPLLLFLSPNVLPQGRGWLRRLGEALAANPAAGMVSPTLLYEDQSIRFAGYRVRPVSRDGSGAGIRSRFAGYPRSWARGRETMRVEAATTECCLLSAEIFRKVDGFAKDCVGDDYKNLDFSLKINAAGLQCLWAPAVEMFAVDPPQAGAPAYWQQVGGLVDRWSFERRWGGEGPMIG